MGIYERGYGHSAITHMGKLGLDVRYEQVTATSLSPARLASSRAGGAMGRRRGTARLCRAIFLTHGELIRSGYRAIEDQ
jgi:hypothetical protein